MPLWTFGVALIALWLFSEYMRYRANRELHRIGCEISDALHVLANGNLHSALQSLEKVAQARLHIEMQREANRQQDREARITAANGKKLPTLFKIGDEIFEMKDDGSIIRRVEGDRPHVRVVTDPSPDAPRFESVP